jgi:transcriptional regulator with XRE-family HTH domain
MVISSEQVRAARALLRWEQKDLAAASGISLPAIKRMETVRGPLAAQARTIEAIRAAFHAAGVEFTNGGQPGVRMRIMAELEQGVAELLEITSSEDSLENVLARAKLSVDAYLVRSGSDKQLARGELRRAFADNPRSHTAAGNAVVEWMDTMIS